jgi:hypothetical protein
MLTVQVLGRPDLLWITPPLSGELIRCQSEHGDYACSRDGVAVSGGNGMNSNTRVLVARCLGACGYVLSYLALNGHVIQGPPSLRSLARFWRPSGVATGGLGVC